MSISVTVSGEDSTSVILAQALSDAVTISGSSAVEVTTTSGNSATITVSTGDPITITGNYSNYVTGDVVRPPEISDFLTENQINSKITTATGDYNTLANNSFYPKSNPSGYITGVDLSAYATEEFATGLSGYLQGQISSNNSEIAEIVDVTGSFALKSETGSFISESQTGQFYASSNPSGFTTGVDLSALETATGNLDTRVSSNSLDILSVSGLITSNDGDISELQAATGLLVQKSETGSFISESQTGQFYATSNPSGFITGVDLSSYVQDSETGLFLVSGEDAVVNTIGVGGSPDPNIDIHVKSDSAKFLVENTLGGGEWVRFSAGTIGTSMKFSNTASFSIGPVASKTDTSVVDDFYMASNSNVGIGTSSPSQKLDVNGKIKADGIIIGNNSITNDDTVRIESAGGQDLEIASTRDVRILIDSNNDDATNRFEIQSNTNTSNDNNILMVVEQDGDVGIGTSSPSGKLHIVGSEQNSYVEPIVENTAAAGAAGFAFINSTQEWKMGVNTANTFRIRDHNAGENIFQIEPGAPGNSLIIDSNGKTTAKQIEATSSSYPVLGFTRETSTAGGSLDSVNGIASAMKLTTKTNANMTDGFGGGIVFTFSDNTLENTANARIYARRDGSDENSALQFFNKGTDATGSSMIIRSNGNVGIGTNNPVSLLNIQGDSADLFITQGDGKNSAGLRSDSSGNGVLQLFADSVNNLAANSKVNITAATGDNSWINNGGNVGIGTTSPSEKLHVIGNTLIDGDLEITGDSSFQNRPTVNGTGVLLSGEGGGGTVANVVYTTGDQTISGTKSFGKISLSENSFVTETGSFTMGSAHRGATVLLQNSAPMTVTIPAQVSGHTTTFIAETINAVIFSTGAGISGFNSFNSANQIAGIYGQAQVIFKSPEYAFLGGNVV